MLIGVQELGRWRKDFSKEEKQDLMHIGTCEVLAADGHYTFTHRDADGWPHYRSELPNGKLSKYSTRHLSRSSTRTCSFKL